MSPSGLHVNKPVLILIFGLVVAGIVWYKMSGSSPSVVSVSADDSKDVAVKAVTDFKVQVDGKEVTVAYREVKPENSLLDVLFLHGQSFKSLTWVSEPVWTLQKLYKQGYRAVAIDLPGYGDSPQAAVEHVAYLEAVIAGLKLETPVIVSPSMSGGFALPYLFKEPGNVLKRARGFVAVAPVATDNYTAEEYKSLQIPTLIIYGEKDKNIGATALKNLKNLPKSKIEEIKDAGHACYMNKPNEFHEKLFQFLKTLKP